MDNIGSGTAWNVGLGYFLKRGTSESAESTTIRAHFASTAHPTIIGAYGQGAMPSFNGAGAGAQAQCFFFGNSADRYNGRCEYIYMYDIEIRNYAWQAINAYKDSKNMGFYNIYMHNNNKDTGGESNLVVSTASYADILQYDPYEFINCQFDTAGINVTSGASHIKIGTSPVTVTNCRFGISNGDCLRLADGSHGGKVKHCTFDNGIESVSYGYYNNSQCRMHNSVYEDCRFFNAATGIMMTSPTDEYYIHPDYVTIKNCYFYGQGYASIFMNKNVSADNVSVGHVYEDNLLKTKGYGIRYKDSQDLIIRRNSIVGMGTLATDGIINADADVNTDIYYNVIYGFVTNGINLTVGSGAEVYNNTVDGAISLSGTTETVRNNFFKSLTGAANYDHNLDVDDISTANYFTDYANKDYRLKSTATLAIDGGLDLDLTPDIQGTSVGDSPDIGAYEYVPGSVTVTITASDANASETGPDSGTFTVSRGAVTSGNLTVNYAKSGSTTSADYTQSLTGSVTISNGSSTATVTITPVDDATDEGDETVVLTLTSGTGYTVGSPSTATVTIADNDGYQNPVAHWMFEQNGDDASGNGHNLTLYGTPSYVTGADGYGISLNGSALYADCSTVDLGSQFTITGWYKFTGTTQRTLAANSTWQTPNGFWLYMYTPSGQFRFKTGNGSSTLEATSTTGHHTDGTWIHFAVVVNKATGTCNFYVNGVNRSNSSPIRTDFVTNSTILLGRTTDNQAKLYGNLDDVRIYDYQLAGSDISDIYNLLKSARVTTGAFNQVDSDITVFPVPCIDFLTINGSKEIRQIVLVNLLGQPVLEQNNTAGTSNIKVNTSTLKSGYYVLKLIDHSGKITSKSIVKK